jgi:hypothetical protein
MRRSAALFHKPLPDRLSEITPAVTHKSANAAHQSLLVPDEGFVLVLRYVAAMSSKLRAMLMKACTNCQASQSPNPATPM